MISYAHINNKYEELLMTDPFILCESTINKISNETNEYIDNFRDSYNTFIAENAILGDIDPINIYTEASNVFEKIGDSIIAIFNKFKDLVKDIINKISEIGFKKKTDLEKLDKMLAAHPDLKNDILLKFNEGDLLLSDARSLSEIEKAYDEILKAAKDASIDTNSFKGKVATFKKKLKESDKSAVVKGAAAVGTVVTVSTGIFMLRKHIKEIPKTNNEILASEKKMSDATIETIRVMNTPDKNGNKEIDKIDTSAGKAGVLRQLQEEMTIGSMNKVKTNYKFFTSLSNSVSSFTEKIANKIDKEYDTKKAEKAAALDKEGKDFLNSLVKRANSVDRYELNKDKKKSQASAKGSDKGHAKYRDKHNDAVLNRIYDDEATKQQARDLNKAAGPSEELKAYQKELGSYKAKQDIKNRRVSIRTRRNNKPNQ